MASVRIFRRQGEAVPLIRAENVDFEFVPRTSQAGDTRLTAFIPSDEYAVLMFPALVQNPFVQAPIDDFRAYAELL